jgi:hypothetical protein
MQMKEAGYGKHAKGGAGLHVILCQADRVDGASMQAFLHTVNNQQLLQRLYVMHANGPICSSAL